MKNRIRKGKRKRWDKKDRKSSLFWDTAYKWPEHVNVCCLSLPLSFLPLTAHYIQAPSSFLPNGNKPIVLALESSLGIFHTFLLASLEAFLSLPGFSFIYLHINLFQSFLSETIHTDTIYNIIGGQIGERSELTIDNSRSLRSTVLSAHWPDSQELWKRGCMVSKRAPPQHSRSRDSGEAQKWQSLLLKEASQQR